ncbi:hypothetical protein BGX38DRAFT_1146838 [Terfezia claveryi]|nr:hypothetical protein BGX38DRAFT_1146838 [Terfezia claveryi]
MPSETGSRAGSQKILGKAQDALRDRKVRKGRTRCLGRQIGDVGGSKMMPSETGKSGKDVQGASETDGRHGRQQNISVSRRHYSAVRSQKILGKAWDAPRDRETGSWEGAYRMPQETRGRISTYRMLWETGRKLGF